LLRAERSRVFARPGTAQGICDYLKTLTSSWRVKPRFVLFFFKQKTAYEITPGNFLFRMREFEQMEMEFFVPPAEADRWYREWIDLRRRWYLDLGLRGSHLRVREHTADELSHYSRGTSDLESLFPIRWSDDHGI